MTEYLQAFWLALLQGLTEFLPVSSSGHLVLLPSLFGWTDQGLAFDVAVHLGSLIAVIVYFRVDVRDIVRDWLAALAGGPKTLNSKLGWYLVAATAMISIAGYFLEPVINRWLRNPVPVALATILFALLLGWYDYRGAKQRDIATLGWGGALLIGAAQILALIPGTSRSGVTITAGLALGLTREAAARFSFLLAIPVILVASIWQSRQLLYSDVPVSWLVLAFATLVSAITAFACIHWFLRFLRRFGLGVFVVYRVLLGLLILLLLA